MSWRLAKSLDTLRTQVNQAYPKRSKASDGTIGDTAHSSRTSQHNPNFENVVTAFDITEDHANGPDLEELAEALLKDPRTWYVIYEDRIRYPVGGWQPYSGMNPHDKHLHISVKQTKAAYDDAREWELEEEMKPTKNEVDNAFNFLGVPDSATPKDKNYTYYMSRSIKVLYNNVLRALYNKWQAERTAKMTAEAEATKLKSQLDNQSKEVTRLQAVEGNATKWETVRVLLRELLGIK